MPDNFTDKQLLDAKHDLSHAAERSLLAYWDQDSKGFHIAGMIEHIGRACISLGITVNADGKVERIVKADAADASAMAEA